LVECIDSILNQQCEFEFEIIVHDDASTDKSLELLHNKYPQVRTIESKENVGFCISNNRMVSQASGEFILLLNNDATLMPDALTTFYKHASSQPISGILTLPQYDWETGHLVDRGCLLDLFYNPVPNLDPGRTSVAMVIGACLWIPKKLWIELGGFPVWFESIAEDMQICCHARLAGFPVEVTQKSGYRHQQGNSFGGNRITDGRLKTTYRRRRLSERNKTFVMSVCTPFPVLWLLLPLHILTLTLEGLLLALFKRDRRLFVDIYANAIYSVIHKRQRISEERLLVQISRVTPTKIYLSSFTLFPHKLRMLIRYGIPRLTC